MNCLHRLLCNSVNVEHRRSAFCLSLLPVDSWDSCCWLHWKPSKPLLLPRGRRSRQAAAGWAQCLFAAGVCQPSHPWLPQKRPGQSSPDSVGGSWWAVALICWSAYGGWTQEWNPSGPLQCKTVIRIIFAELVESAVCLGITHVSPPSFLYSDFAPSQRITALTVQR